VASVKPFSASIALRRATSHAPADGRCRVIAPSQVKVNWQPVLRSLP